MILIHLYINQRSNILFIFDTNNILYEKVQIKADFKMKISTRFDKEEIHRGKGTARILFKYYEENYQEIMTTKNFGFESFVSGVGGFVGIFLGYSILQLPEIFTLLRSFTVILKKYQPSGKFNK